MTSQLMHQQLLALVAEKILNPVLALSPTSTNGLAALEQKTLVIELVELGFPLSITVVDAKVLVTGLVERSDCTVSTSLSTIQELKQQQQLTELIKQDKLAVVGDIKVAQQFANLFEQLNIDWQSELAKHIGDIPTYKAGQLVAWLKSKINFASQQISADASEWLVFEKRLAVTAPEIAQFVGQVAETEKSLVQLTERVDKLIIRAKQSVEGGGE